MKLSSRILITLTVCILLSGGLVYLAPSTRWASTNAANSPNLIIELAQAPVTAAPSYPAKVAGMKSDAAPLQSKAWQADSDRAASSVHSGSVLHDRSVPWHKATPKALGHVWGG